MSPDPCRDCAPLVHRAPYRPGPQLTAVGHISCFCPISKDCASFPNQTSPRRQRHATAGKPFSRAVSPLPLMTWHQVTQSQLPIKAEVEPNMKGSGQEMPHLSFKAGVKPAGRTPNPAAGSSRGKRQPDAGTAEAGAGRHRGALRAVGRNLCGAYARSALVVSASKPENKSSRRPHAFTH